MTDIQTASTETLTTIRENLKADMKVYILHTPKGQRFPEEAKRLCDLFRRVCAELYRREWMTRHFTPSLN